MAEANQTRKIIAILNDIIFASKIREAAKPLGLEIEFLRTPNGIAQKIKSEKPSLIILDLNCNTHNPVQTITQLKSSPKLSKTPLLGYLSHVQADLRKEAIKAGCDIVLPRSRFSREVGEILRRYSSQG